MLISSHQHRNLRQFIIVAFVTVLVISALLWFFVNKHIEDNMHALVIQNNLIAATSFSSTLDMSQIKHPDYQAVVSVDLMRYLKAFDIVEIDIADEQGKVLVTTNQNLIDTAISSKERFANVLNGENISFNLKNTVISMVPVYSVTQNKNNASPPADVVAVVKIVKNNKVLIDDIRFVKYLMLAALLFGISILFAVFYFMARYSDNLVGQYAKQIVTQSKSDPVTGLLNRHHFFRLIRKTVNKLIQENSRAALFIIDIDHFKELNAKYDHTFGDEVLKIITQRLSRLIGPADTLARSGDDEFSIFMAQSESNSMVRKIARKILDKVNEPFQIDASYIHLTCSIGISVLNQDAREMEELIQHADSALYNAKDFGRNNFQLFSRGGGTRHIKFYEKQYSLNKALDENEFVLYLQPKVNGETGALVGCETLLRWKNPDYGLIQPAEFLPALESSGLIHKVGNWVLKESCRICKQWQEHGGAAIPVSVNVSALQFKNENFVSNVSEILRSTGLDGHLLEIELTETCLMDNVEQSLHILHALKAFGIRITIDDFGTGYSSLNYLKRFPIDVLKIDHSFVTNINDRTQNENAAIVTAIMALSHSLHLEVIADGVETANELAYLSALGCKIVQGSLFSAPLPIDEFNNLLTNDDALRQTLAAIRKQLA